MACLHAAWRVAVTVHAFSVPATRLCHPACRTHMPCNLQDAIAAAGIPERLAELLADPDRPSQLLAARCLAFYAAASAAACAAPACEPPAAAAAHAAEPEAAAAMQEALHAPFIVGALWGCAERYEADAAEAASEAAAAAAAAAAAGASLTPRSRGGAAPSAGARGKAGAAPGKDAPTEEAPMVSAPCVSPFGRSGVALGDLTMVHALFKRHPIAANKSIHD